MCDHERVFVLSGKANDMSWWSWPNGQTGQGYAPNIPGLGGGDYVEVKLCIDCRTVLDLPTTEEFLAIQDEYCDDD